MNQDEQSEVIEREARAILNRHCEYMDGLDRGQRTISTSNALEAVKEALSRPSLSTPSEGVIEQRAAADYVDRQDCRVQDRHGDWDGYTGQQMVECFLAGVALARLSPLPLVEENHG